MPDQQLDLFSAAPVWVAPPQPSRRLLLAAQDLDDEALIAALGEATLDDSAALAAEAGRRQLRAAVPALAALCRRFAGFGLHRPVPEQVAALDALAAIGGREAAQAVAQLLDKAIVQGPTLTRAVEAAARLRSRLSVALSVSLLRHAEPAIRADACRCARPVPEVILLLVELLDDLDRTVAKAAACALGLMGRPEARPALERLLREEPSAETIEAMSLIADEEGMVLLGRLARSTPRLADAALDALESIEHPRAAKIAASLRTAVDAAPCSGTAGSA